jgi:hypothetical protein
LSCRHAQVPPICRLLPARIDASDARRTATGIQMPIKKPDGAAAGLVLLFSFSEYAPEPNPETKKKDVVWFALNEARPLFAFAGIRVEIGCCGCHGITECDEAGTNSLIGSCEQNIRKVSVRPLMLPRAPREITPVWPKKISNAD